MGDSFVKLVLAKDYVTLGKLGLAIAGVELVSEAALTAAKVVVDAMADHAPHAKKLSNPITFLTHDEAKAQRANS